MGIQHEAYYHQEGSTLYNCAGWLVGWLVGQFVAESRPQNYLVRFSTEIVVGRFSGTGLYHWGGVG